ncbi:increased DNA methylation 3-like isoform X2 [Impatiens glandulifera]|uniref:increased DNA methylation 3-like isoform X2 n=1 Tax=Impatiens glandulifera TaxID=253017 RepID=UPI001FB0A78C|nr:increased DNA methylation 3-like isoform X2 [Impatiens glandulifera]
MEQNDLTVDFQHGLAKRPKHDTSNMQIVPRTGTLEGVSLMMPLLPVPCLGNVDSMLSITYSGTVTRGKVGAAIGTVDIGVNDYAYFFRIALPGVSKDPGRFSCEIESDGKVNVRGMTTTGGQTVERHSRVYQMKLQQQCPPGQFTLSFCLPGPVDPRLFSPNFRSDGVFEAIVVKHVNS